MKKFSLNLRECDSKNLNLSPFCDLSQHYSPAFWADQAKTAYLNAGKSIDDPGQGQEPQEQVPVPPFVNKLPSPIRDTYYNDKRKAQELFTERVQVDKAIVKDPTTDPTLQLNVVYWPGFLFRAMGFITPTKKTLLFSTSSSEILRPLVIIIMRRWLRQIMCTFQNMRKI